MDQKLLKAVQKTAAQVEESQPSLRTYFRHLAQKAAEEQGVEVEHASDNKVPSSASAEGMEDRNQGYGHTATDLDKIKAEGGKETGQVRNAKGAQNLTTENEGMPNLGLGKVAALQFLLKTSAQKEAAGKLKKKLQAVMVKHKGK